MSGASDTVARTDPPASGVRSPREVAAAVSGPDGFTVVRALEGDELRRVRGAVEAQWLERLAVAAPEQVEAFRERGIERYHELSHLVDHASLWPKAARILPAEAVTAIRATKLCRLLEDAFGPFAISDEEGLGREEIYWRIVRPADARSMVGPADARSMVGPADARSKAGPADARSKVGPADPRSKAGPSSRVRQPQSRTDGARDTGPVHADRWFWELGHGTTPPGVARVKVWVALVTEPGLSGLRVLRGSHLRDWRYHGEMRDGFIKPMIDEDVDALGLELVRTEPGDAVVFNDGLLHGGGESLGAWTRVSFELTMFVGRPADD